MLFPKRYGDLTTELLGYLGGPDSSEVTELFEQRRQRRLAGAQPRLTAMTFDEQVAELTRILDEDGYLADGEELDGGGWRITEHNCAILSVATGFRQACSSEIAFIRDALPGARVERVAHLMDGAHVCAYEVHASPDERLVAAGPAVGWATNDRSARGQHGDDDRSSPPEPAGADRDPRAPILPRPRRSGAPRRSRPESAPPSGCSWPGPAAGSSRTSTATASSTWRRASR